MVRRLARDTRGAQLAEYLILVAVVAVAALSAFRLFGSTASAKIEREGACIEAMSSSGCVGATGAAAQAAQNGQPPPAQPNDARPLPARAIEAAGALAASAVNAATANTAAPRAPTNVEIARRLVRAGGTANQADVNAVVASLATLPRPVLQYMAQHGVTVVAAKNSVTDYLSELRGVRPRGWPPGSSWDTVPGLARGREVVIAVRNGRVPATGNGHGSHDLVIHEVFHAIDNTGNFSSSPAFVRARDADAANLEPYLLQPGAAGLQEAYAESAARFFRGDTEWGRRNPNLWAYWQAHAPTLVPTN